MGMQKPYIYTFTEVVGVLLLAKPYLHSMKRMVLLHPLGISKGAAVGFGLATTRSLLQYQNNIPNTHPLPHTPSIDAFIVDEIEVHVYFTVNALLSGVTMSISQLHRPIFVQGRRIYTNPPKDSQLWFNKDMNPILVNISSQLSPIFSNKSLNMRDSNAVLST